MSTQRDPDDHADLVTALRRLPDPPDHLRRAAVAYFERRKAIEDLIARMTEDPALRARAARDPAGLLREAGLDPDPGLISALQDAERGSSDAGQRLAARLWF